MTYFIKCLVGIHSKDDFTIKAGDEKEVSKEIYDYFNQYFGASGNFNFKTSGDNAKRKTKPKKPAKDSEDLPSNT